MDSEGAADHLKQIIRIIEANGIQHFSIEKSATHVNAFNQLMAYMQTLRKEAQTYCSTRDAGLEHQMKLWYRVRQDLVMIFSGDFVIEIIPMSSFPNMHMIDGSDCDFGVVVQDLTDRIKTFCRTKLIQHGFAFKETNYGYDIYSKTIEKMEFEIKVRDRAESEKIISLHHALDSADTYIHQLITYLKALTYGDKVLYAKIKGIIFSAFYTGIAG